MSLETAAVTVATTETALTALEGAGSDAVTVRVSVVAAGQTVYVGPTGVTTATGYPIATGAADTFTLGQGDRLFGIVAATTQAVRVLRVGVG